MRAANRIRVPPRHLPAGVDAAGYGAYTGSSGNVKDGWRSSRAGLYEAMAQTQSIRAISSHLTAVVNTPDIGNGHTGGGGGGRACDVDGRYDAATVKEAMREITAVIVHAHHLPAFVDAPGNRLNGVRGVEQGRCAGAVDESMDIARACHLVTVIDTHSLGPKTGNYGVKNAVRLGGGIVDKPAITVSCGVQVIPDHLPAGADAAGFHHAAIQDAEEGRITVAVHEAFDTEGGAVIVISGHRPAGVDTRSIGGKVRGAGVERGYRGTVFYEGMPACGIIALSGYLPGSVDATGLGKGAIGTVKGGDVRSGGLYSRR